MKMTKKQAKIILIVGWSFYAFAHLSSIILCIHQTNWLSVTLLLCTGWLMIAEYRRYIRHLKKKK